MKKALINVIKGFIKILFFYLFWFFMLPVILLAAIEDCGSGKGWLNDGFFYKLITKLERKVENAK